MQGRIPSTTDLWERLNQSVIKLVAQATVAASALFFVVFALRGPANVPWFGWALRTGTLGAVAAASVVTLVLARRGRPRAATIVYVAQLFILLLLSPIVLGLGVHGASLPILVLLVLVSALLISSRAAWVVTGASVAMTWAFFVAETAGVMSPARELLPNALVLTLGLTTLFVLVAAVSSHYATVFRATLENLSTSQARLESTVAFQQQTEQRLLVATESAQAASRAKSDFLATMSHEIRTPLNGILGMGQLLQADDLPDDQRREFARVIVNSGQVLLAVINDLLDFSKVETGKLELHPRLFNPVELINETLAPFAEVARSQNEALEGVWVGAQNQTYVADAIRIRQMLGNLVSNATRFSSCGFVRVRAEELGRTTESAVLKFAVQDSGVGIPHEKLRDLFQPFTRVDEAASRAHAGTGLGLSIVAGLAHLMDGDVGVETTPGIGSTFWFLVRVALETVPVPDVLPRSAPPPTWPGHRVLVVEDNPINRRVLEVFLSRRRLGYTCVENGAEALEVLAREEPFDLVFMDCQMPVMDGLEATRQLRTREHKHSLPRLPVIAITAGALPAERARCFDAGMDDFLSKPVELRTLDEVLAKWLGPKERLKQPA